MFFGFGALKLILRGVFAQKPHFYEFSPRCDVSQILLWLTYTCNFAPNRLKWSGIVKWKMSETFVKLSLTVWEIWPEKWHKMGVLNQFLKSTNFIGTVFLNFSLHISPYSYLFPIHNTWIIPRKIHFPCRKNWKPITFKIHDIVLTEVEIKMGTEPWVKCHF